MAIARMTSIMALAYTYTFQGIIATLMVMTMNKIRKN
jgi:hypothetical protein